MYFTMWNSKNEVKDTLKAFDDCKNKQKSVWSSIFWYIKACTLWKCIHYTTHWDKPEIFLKNSFGENKRYKKCPVFLSRAPTPCSFTSHLRFLYELNHNVSLSKTVCAIFHFKFRFVFIKVYIFVQKNAWTLWL